jgi:putative tributyrin esterase
VHLRIGEIPLALLFACLPASLAGQSRLETVLVPSRALGVSKAVMVYLPSSYETSSRRYPVAYYLHGVGGTENAWTRRVALDSLADSLDRAGRGETIIVMPDGDSGYWTDWEEPDVYSPTCPSDPLRIGPDEPSATYCVPHGRYESYLVRDVVPFVDSAYRTLRDRGHRGLGGLSMGGYGAFALALRHPDLFTAAVSHSGPISPLDIGRHPCIGRDCVASTVSEILAHRPSSPHRLLVLEFGSDTSGWWARDPSRLLKRLLAGGRRIPALYFDVGTEDQFLDQNRAFADTLMRRKVAHSYHEYPGGHNQAYWRAHAAEGLDWLLGQIAR